MNMTTDQLLTAIGLIGIGGLLKSLIDYIVTLFKTKADSKHLFKETRYKAILLLCYAYTNFEKDKLSLIIKRPDINSSDQLYEEISAEWVNMALYASDQVILKMREFLEKKDQAAYNDLIITMRKDLYGIKSKLEPQNFILRG